MRIKIWNFIQISIWLFYYNSFNARVDAVECNLEPKNTEGRLRKTLFCSYDKDNRPILASDSPIVVKFKMIVKGFLFEDTSGKLTVSTWLAMSWTDEHLKWDPKDFSNLASITQSSDTIWTPDLALYNSDVASTGNEFCKDAHCVITAGGVVSCIPPCSHAARCSPDYTRWPFDRQNCTLHIGTWVNSGDEIDFKVMKVILDDELSSQNLEWKMLRASYKRNHGNFSDTRQTYPSLTFSFTMKRHSATHATMMLIPALSLVSLNLISLWVDSETNRRIILLSLSLYGHFIYMQHLYWAVPYNGDSVPDIVIYFRDSLLITVILIVNTIIVQGLSTCGVGLPKWIESTTNYMNSNRYGRFFLTKHLVKSDRFNGSEDGSTEDDINLVESQANEKRSEKDKPKMWRTFGNIIDRLLFAGVGLAYIIMMISLIPEKLFDGEETNSVEIVAL